MISCRLCGGVDSLKLSKKQIVVDKNRGVPGLWEGYHESRRCSRDTYPESYIENYTSVRRKSALPHGRAFAVKVVPKRLPVFPFSGLLKDCKGHKTHRFETGGRNQIRKTGKREVVLGQPLPQTLYAPGLLGLTENNCTPG